LLDLFKGVAIFAGKRIVFKALRLIVKAVSAAVVLVSSLTEGSGSF
jgi:hypothetical protein